jgi:hypothetical protein
MPHNEGVVSYKLGLHRDERRWHEKTGMRGVEAYEMCKTEKPAASSQQAPVILSSLLRRSEFRPPCPLCRRDLPTG